MGVEDGRTGFNDDDALRAGSLRAGLNENRNENKDAEDGG
jgi:hypothetical protein